MHHRGALGRAHPSGRGRRRRSAHLWESRSQPCAELIHAVNHDVAALTQARTRHFKTFDGGWAEVGPYDVGELAEDAIQIDAVGLDQAVREEVKAQVSISGVRRGGVEVDLCEDYFLLCTAIGVLAVVGQCSECGIGILDVTKGFSGYTCGRRRVPDIQYGCFPEGEVAMVARPNP